MSNYPLIGPMIMFYPELAKLLNGADRAIVLQEVAFQTSQRTRLPTPDEDGWGKIKETGDGRRWIKRESLYDKLVWLSPLAIDRMVRYLEVEGYLESATLNDSPMDATKWYTVDTARLMGVESD